MPWVYTKYLVISTALIGALLHTAGLLLGKDYFIEHLYTPTFDMLFAVPITLGAIGLILNIRKAKNLSITLKIVYYFATLLFVVSIPIHLYTYISHSTEYIRLAPPLYSIIEIPLFLIIVFGLYKIR
jgi:hypothetical protein